MHVAQADVFLKIAKNDAINARITVVHPHEDNLTMDTLTSVFEAIAATKASTMESISDENSFVEKVAEAVRNWSDDIGLPLEYMSVEILEDIPSTSGAGPGVVGPAGPPVTGSQNTTPHELAYLPGAPPNEPRPARRQKAPAWAGRALMLLGSLAGAIITLVNDLGGFQ
ncbi:hypothetical protein GP486_000065 [Trichoglossum hirsutum]|uniref:Uncharacterized protein n=1 Tax=Trichoglossum hirsutum TaxID=265104 RepID=A0A9P8LJK6_9PEZI|nr:hypothetical protein GP486_000065 [Trichoglossum hirsutum]